MVFSSIPFLYYFLPAVMLVYFAAPGKLKNGVLLLFSLLFYGWSEPRLLALMVITILLFYLCGLAIGKTRRKAFLVLGVVLGLILGSLLALARTYCKKGPARILGWFSAAYIELFRNTPYLLWIFVCVVFCPCPAFFARKMFGLTSVEMKLLFKAALALILFNSSVIAEIVRGGLMSVDVGQTEAGRSLGLNYLDTMRFIVIPSAC